MGGAKTRVGAVLAAAIWAGGAAASAQELGGPGAAHLYGQPDSQIAARPGDADVMAAWPAKAKARGLGGSAVMHCLADAEGALGACHVMLERNHASFGEALLSLAP